MSDRLLRLMAHGAFERRMQERDPAYAIQRLCEHHGWTAVPRTAEETGEGTQAAGLATDAMQLSSDQVFDISPPKDKWHRVAAVILDPSEAVPLSNGQVTDGEEGFFGRRCWGFYTENGFVFDKTSTLECFLTKAYWALKHIGHVPPADEETDAVQQLADLLFAWLGNDGSDHLSQTKSLSLQAHARILSPQERMCREVEARQLDLHSGRRTRFPDPYIEYSLGQTMEVVENSRRDFESPVGTET